VRPWDYVQDPRVPDALRHWREGAALTQEQMADRLELHRATYNAYEKGRRPVTAELLAQFAEHFNTTPDGLLAAVGAAPTSSNLLTVFSTTMPQRYPDRVRAWIQRFLGRLAEGGATDDELTEAKTLLMAPALAGYMAGGVQAIDQWSEDDVIKSLEAVGNYVIIPALQKRGRSIEAP
jgi:transcriptional regulator with XRE-family HTH domain